MGADSRTAVALIVSVGVHALVLWSLRRAEETPLLHRAQLELTDLTWLEAPAAETGDAVQAAPPRATPPTKKRRAATNPLAKPTSTLADDLPRRLELATSGMPIVVERPRGVTLHPEDLPSEAELRAETEARVEARVDGMLRGALSRARAEKGLPDPVYSVLGEALRTATDEVPSFIDTNSPTAVGKAVAGAWLAGAERYGKTGAPYAEPEGRQEFIERPSMLDDAVARGSPQARELQQFLYAGARLQEFADGRTGLELYALVEVHQLDSGAVESVRLLRPSGLRPFDAWVVEKANGVQVTLAWDGGARRTSPRSVWRFDATMTFRRKLKPSQLNGRAAIGMVAMSALGALVGAGGNGPRMPALSGRFDPITGEADLIDLTNPAYDCRVTLVEAD